VEEAAVEHRLHCVHQRDRESLASGRDLRYRTYSRLRCAQHIGETLNTRSPACWGRSREARVRTRYSKLCLFAFSVCPGGGHIQILKGRRTTWSHFDRKKPPFHALYQESSFTNLFLGTLPSHSWLRVELWSNTSQVSVTLSVGTSVYPYGIVYGRVLERGFLLTTHWSESALSSR